MTAFSELDVRYLDGRKWMVLSPFTYKHCEFDITVPDGFITDFASTPRIFWRVFPPTGRYGKPAVVHDFMYRLGSLPRTTKNQADHIFLGAMKDAGCGWVTRTCLFLAVHFFGGSSFHARHLRHYEHELTAVHS